MKGTDLALATIVMLTIIVIASVERPIPTSLENDEALYTEVIRELERQ